MKELLSHSKAFTLLKYSNSRQKNFVVYMQMCFVSISKGVAASHFIIILNRSDLLLLF